MSEFYSQLLRVNMPHSACSMCLDAGVTLAGKPCNCGISKSPAIAPPVAAGSVDTLTRYKLEPDSYAGEDWMIEKVDPDGLWCKSDEAIAWGAQQREAGKMEAIKTLMPRINHKSERAEKAEAELKARDLFVDVLNCQVKKAESRVKELEAGRQALQAEGKHPAPCARDCEANAFQIEVRRLQAVELNMHRKLAAEKLRADQGWARYEAANRAKNDLERERGHKQSIIDRLMLEYCPDEMTAEQVEQWGKHQVRAAGQMIAATPGGMVFMNDGAEPGSGDLDCPACGGSGHAGDVPTGSAP